MDEQEYAKTVLSVMKLQKSRNTDRPRFGKPQLEEPHRMILDQLSYEEWTDRRDLLRETGFRRKRLKRHVRFLINTDLVIERNKPEEQRMTQYQRV